MRPRGCRQLWVWWQAGLRVNSRSCQTCLHKGWQLWRLSDNILSWGKSPLVIDLRLTKPPRGEQSWLPVCSFSSKSSQESTVPREPGEPRVGQCLGEPVLSVVRGQHTPLWPGVGGNTWALSRERWNEASGSLGSMGSLLRTLPELPNSNLGLSLSKAMLFFSLTECVKGKILSKVNAGGGGARKHTLWYFKCVSYDDKLSSCI